ncbi:chemotaxis protein CheW [Spartinivicinus ruber]|uniref:chemotaxis protein CheW n=1 Tax=Spartinivicinus ruber TaxID=2683272 RepID=UPI0013D6044E|nr:chemotaxis protein CheW [Spartinivicinus ruber]
MATEQEGQLSALLVPIQDKMLLVPNVTIAELINFEKPNASGDTPDWHLGQLTWREQTIPVVSFEIANGEEYRGDTSNARVAIVNGITGQRELPFYAIIVQGIPHSVKLTENEIVKQDENLGEVEMLAVQASGEPAVIPNLDKLEKMILDFGLA